MERLSAQSGLQHRCREGSQTAGGTRSGGQLIQNFQAKYVEKVGFSIKGCSKCKLIAKFKRMI